MPEANFPVLDMVEHFGDVRGVLGGDKEISVELGPQAAPYGIASLQDGRYVVCRLVVCAIGPPLETRTDALHYAQELREREAIARAERPPLRVVDGGGDAAA